MATPATSKLSLAAGLLSLLMVSHLTFLGLKHPDPDAFMEAAETYVTVILALMAPTPLLK